jgi:diketogulonate reductase-like aldo/keto reductase
VTRDESDEDIMMNSPSIRLTDDVAIPQIGFGVFQVPPDGAQKAVEAALGAGYRHVDTAAAYNNEKGVGAAVRASGLPRDQIFVTTKLRNGEHGTESAAAAFESSLVRLGLDYVDLYLIHWPSPARNRYVESWRVMESLVADGRARSIGVSNFLPHHLERLIRETETVPAVNQIEVHPRFQQRDVVAFSRGLGIAIEAYSPLGQGAELDDPVILDIARTRGISPAQVILRWHLQSGNIVIPKSVDPSRMAQNLDVTEFELSAEEFGRITDLESGERIGADPDTFEITQIR